jgi:purine-binding chemotaxis protein CheW
MAGRERSADEVRRLKLERAARYAGASITARAAAPAGPLHLVVGLAGERLALDASAVVAVASPSVVSPLPFAPPHVAGGTPFRGAPVLAVDLHPLAGRTWAPAPAARHVVVSWPGGGEVALRVDEVDGVRPLPPDLRPAPALHWLPAPVVRALLEDGTAVVDLPALAAALGSGGAGPPPDPTHVLEVTS